MQMRVQKQNNTSSAVEKQPNAARQAPVGSVLQTYQNRMQVIPAPRPLQKIVQMTGQYDIINFFDQLIDFTEFGDYDYIKDGLCGGWSLMMLKFPGAIKELQAWYDDLSQSYLSIAAPVMSKSDIKAIKKDKDYTRMVNLFSDTIRTHLNLAAEDDSDYREESLGITAPVREIYDMTYEAQGDYFIASSWLSKCVESIIKQNNVLISLDNHYMSYMYYRERYLLCDSDNNIYAEFDDISDVKTALMRSIISSQTKHIYVKYNSFENFIPKQKSHKGKIK